MLFQWLSNRFLKEFTEGASITFWGRLFQALTTHWLKKFCLTLRRLRLTAIFKLCPRRLCLLSARQVFSFLCCLFYSYNRRWNQLVSVRRPSIWNFIRRLKDEERRIWRNVRHVRAGVQPSVRRRKWRQLEERIERLKTQYSNGTITLKQYWNAIRFVTHQDQ